MGDDVAKLSYRYGFSTQANSVIRQNVWVCLDAKAALELAIPDVRPVLDIVTLAFSRLTSDCGQDYTASHAVTGSVRLYL